MMKGSAHQEDIKILNLITYPNKSTSILIKPNLTDLKRELDKPKYR